MRALSHCDFCGADAAGTFELLPPELEPTEAEQRRVVLCRSCGDHLEDLLEPLLARAGVDRSSTANERSEETDGVEGADAEDADDDGTASGDSPASSEPTGRPTVIDVDEANTRGDANESATRTDATAEEDPRTVSASDTDRGITIEHSDETEPDNDEPSASARSSSADSDAGSSTNVDTATDTTTATDADTATDAAPDSDADSSAEADSSSGDDPVSSSDERRESASSGRPPSAYGKVVRLLRNREFPMERDAVETLAVGAYDLEAREVEAIIEYALEDGEFAEDGDTPVRA